MEYYQAEKRSYYAIIPANVRYNKNISANAKLLFGEITALCNEKGYCWASNKYFAELYKVSNKTVSRWFQELKNAGFISIEIKYKEGSKEIVHRYVRICPQGTDEIVHTPMDKKVKDNITCINNTLNNTFEEREESALSQEKDFETLPEEKPDENINSMHSRFTWAKGTFRSLWKKYQIGKKLPPTLHDEFTNYQFAFRRATKDRDVSRIEADFEKYCINFFNSTAEWVQKSEYSLSFLLKHYERFVKPQEQYQQKTPEKQLSTIREGQAVDWDWINGKYDNN